MSVRVWKQCFGVFGTIGQFLSKMMVIADSVVKTNFEFQRKIF